MDEPLKASSLKKYLISGSAWAFGGRLVAAFTGLISNALLARLLSPQEFGTYFLAFNIISFGTVLGSLGLNQTVMRFVAESLGQGQFSQARWVVRVTLGLGAAGALVVSAGYLLVGRFVGLEVFNSPALVAITGMVAGWMAVTSLQTILSATFRGFYDIRLATIFGGLVTSILLATGLVLLWAAEVKTSLSTVMMLAVSSGATSALLAAWILRRKLTTLAPGEAANTLGIREVLRVTWPLFVVGLASSAFTLSDVWILSAFRSQEEVAVYGAAARLVTMVAMPLMIINAVVPPLIAGMYAQGRTTELESLLRSTSTLASMPAFLVLVSFVLLGSPILGLVYGDYYRDGATVLAILSIGKMVIVWTGSCGMTLMMTGHQMLMMVITIVTSALVVVAGLVVVGTYGALGVAAAVAIGFAVQDLLWWLSAKLTTGMWTHINVASLASLLGSVRNGLKQGR